MSRSYKKHPVFAYNLDDSKNVKRIFNRKLRHNGLENYKAKALYKKLNRSWMIHEFKDHYSYDKFLKCLSSNDLNKLGKVYRNSQRNEWMKKYLRK